MSAANPGDRATLPISFPVSRCALNPRGAVNPTAERSSNRLMRSRCAGDSIATKVASGMTVTRTRRSFLTLIVSLLLVGMQLGAQLHALDHDDERFARPHGKALLVPGAADACAACASFAGGSHAIANFLVTIGASPPRNARPSGAFVSADGTPPAYYQTRAPPALL
jgi:hypothetical protein